MTSPACLPVQHGHRDSLLAWRPPERKFPPPSPAARTFDGGALSAFQKVAPDAVPFGPGLPQGHGGWNQGAGARSNRPLGAVAGVRPLWAGGSGQGSPWDILGAMPACPGPPVRPETAPAARGPGRGIRLGEGKHGLAPSSALWHFSAYTCTESLEADRAHQIPNGLLLATSCAAHPRIHTARSGSGPAGMPPSVVRLGDSQTAGPNSRSGGRAGPPRRPVSP